MFSSSHIPLIVGIVLLVGAAMIIWRRPSESNPLTVMFLTGVALIFLSDERIQNLKFGASGVEVSREKFREAREDIGDQIASLRAEIEKQKQILDQHQALIAARPSSSDTTRPTSAAPGSGGAPSSAGAPGSSGSPASAGAPDSGGGPASAGTPGSAGGGGAPVSGGSPASAGTSGSAAPVVAEVKQIERKFSENSRYSILIFFRQGQRTVAEALSAKLVEQGYKSSTIATDLSEISIAGVDPKPGTTVIARARQVPASLAQEIGAQAGEIAAAYKLGQPTVNSDEWPFRRGHIQVYMY